MISRMCAFSVIIGDTIPHVIVYLIPAMTEYSFLRFLVDRRTIIVICTIGISFPLSLHRDIVKLSKSSGFGEFLIGLPTQTRRNRQKRLIGDSTGIDVRYSHDGSPAWGGCRA